MRRGGAILLFLLLTGAVFAFLFQYMEKREEARREAEIPAEKILIYTDLPQSAVQAFEGPFFRNSGVKLVVQEMSGAGMVQAARSGQIPDLYVASQKTLMALKEKNLLEPHVSDRTDTVLNACKDGEGYWTGIWLNPAVFAVNAEFASAHPAFFYTWDEVLSRQSVRLVMTDFIASEYSEESLMALVEHFGEEGTFQRLRDASAHIVQYGKYLSTPAQMAAMDKCDIGISGLDEAKKVQQEGLPVRIIYPEDGTFFYLYGAALARDGSQAERAADFIDWLLDSESQEAQKEQNSYHFIYVNDAGMPVDDAGTKLSFWALEKQYTELGKKELLSRWLQEIRFGKE